MLSSLQTTNYRNLRLQSGIALDPLTIFVGPNGSGKSNLVRVLRFLQDALTGQPDERRGVNSFEDAMARFGSGHILDARIAAPAAVTFSFVLHLEEGYEHSLEFRFAVRDENTVTVGSERLYRQSILPQQSSRHIYYEAHTDRPGQISLCVSSAEAAPGASVLHLSGVPTNQLAFNMLTFGDAASVELETALPQGPPFHQGRRLILKDVSNWSFYDSSQMNLDGIRGSEPKTGPSDTLLTPDGKNLVQVLHNLSGMHVDFEDRMTTIMAELFPHTRKLRVRTEGRLTLLLEWFIRDVDRPFYLDEMSDGTVRMLCWAAVLLSPDPPSLIVLDEPEAGVHPAWLRVLAGWIRDAASRTQVILSTHSPDLLDYFTDMPGSVRVFRPAADAPEYVTPTAVCSEGLKEKLAEGWQLGDIYRVGDPGIGGWPW